MHLNIYKSLLSKQENIHSYYSTRFCNMWLCLDLCFCLFTIFHVLMVLSICVYHYYLPSEVSRRVWISRPCLNWVLKCLHKYYPTRMQTGHSLGCLLILSDQIKTNIKPESSHAITDWTLSMILVSKEINLLLPLGCFVVSKVRHSSLLMPVFAVFLYLLTLLITAVRVSLVRIRTCWCDHI